MMEFLSLILKNFAYILKNVKAPRFIKFAFFIFIRGKKIKTHGIFGKNNVVMELNIGNYIDYEIFMNSKYDFLWMENISNYLKNGIFIDIGANIGTYSLNFFKDTKLIYAFEPEFDNYNRMKNTIKYNSIRNIILIRKAVSNKSGIRIKLYLNRKDNSGHSIYNKEQDYEYVRTISLDEFCRKHNLKKIGLIKIDVEGAEFDVLEGARNILKGNYSDAILIEINKPLLERSEKSSVDLYKLMTSYGYIGYYLNKRSKLRRVDSKYIDNICSENILFLKGNEKK